MLSKNEPSSLFSEEIINQMIIDSSWTNLKIEIPTSWIKKFIIDYDINKGAWDRFIFYLHRIEPKIITDLRAFEAQLANNFLSIDETMQLFSMLLYEVQEGSCAYREIDYLKHKIANQYIVR